MKRIQVKLVTDVQTDWQMDAGTSINSGNLPYKGFKNSLRYTEKKIESNLFFLSEVQTWRRIINIVYNVYELIKESFTYLFHLDHLQPDLSFK